MAVQAVKYTLPETDEAFDAQLRSVLIDMLLVMLQDQDMEIRRLAMTTLNSAAHNKPDLILPHLNEIMPIVLHESVIKPELIKEVMLGPFKHTVDDGLEVRKVRPLFRKSLSLHLSHSLHPSSSPCVLPLFKYDGTY